MSVAPRNVTPIISWIRNRLSGRELVSVHRFEGEIAPRTQPDPKVPVGPSHRLSKNWYCDRDGRRTIAPPQVVSKVKALEAGGGQSSVGAISATPKPGAGYNWSVGGDQYYS